jgi:hypothetical protein
VQAQGVVDEPHTGQEVTGGDIVTFGFLGVGVIGDDQVAPGQSLVEQ